MAWISDTSRFGARTAALLGLLFLTSSCINGEPHPARPGSTAPRVVNLPAKSPNTGVDAPPTGLWGKVAGTDVLGGKGLGGTGLGALAVGGDPSKLEARWMPGAGTPFAEFIRAKPLGRTTNPWDVQLRVSNATPIERGDVLLARLWFRAEHAPFESGEAQSELVVELARAPWTKAVTMGIRAGAEWREFLVPFISPAAFAVGDAQLALRMGYAGQVVDVADVRLENFGKQLTLADLPKTRLSYAGREPDAAWRAEAAARIEQNRKGDLQVIVVGKSGEPLAGATVRVEQRTHAFNFGTCVPGALLVNGSEPKVAATLLELFNTATLENDLKWQPLAGDWGRSFTLSRASQAVDWLRQRDIRVRGHVLMWPGWSNVPAYIRRLKNQPDRLREEIAKHISEVAGALRGRVVDWDVLNEPFTNHDLIDILGKDAMVEWFRLARAAEPKANLYINDFAILSGGAADTEHRRHYEATIEYLVGHGAELDGVAFQGHFGTSLTAPTELLQLLDRYAKFGKRLAVTEYDILVDDEDLAADYTRDFYTTLFSYAQVDSLVMWGFWDGIHWKKNAPLYRKDWSEKPFLAEYKRLTQKEWHTSAQSTTDAAGKLSLRGFLGDYDIHVEFNGTSKNVKASLNKGGAVVKVML